VLPDQGRERTEIPSAELSRPLRLCQGLLEHEGVDVDHTVLEQMQSEHADFVVLAAVARELAMTCKENEVVGAVPLLDDVQSFVDLAAQILAVQVTAQKDGLDSLAQFGEGPVSRMLDVVPGEAPQDGFRLGGAEPHRRHVLDHLIVLLADQIPVDWLGERQLQVLVGLRLAGIRSGQLLGRDGLQP
jgi:hypothetical protein